MTMTPVRTYPKHLTLARSDTSVMVRPLQSGDSPKLQEFFLRVPEEDRFYLKEDVTSPDVVEDWVEHIDYRRVLPLVALVDGDIVADASLHRSRSGARRHIGEIRIVVDPRYRNQGLGTMMLRELVDIAYDNGVESLVFELIEGEEDKAIEVAERMGFTRVATLPRFSKDTEGNEHNVAVMLLPLWDWLEWWAF
jgi:L-amino acid N-acyltransferase YncA